MAFPAHSYLPIRMLVCLTLLPTGCTESEAPSMQPKSDSALKDVPKDVPNNSRPVRAWPKPELSADGSPIGLVLSGYSSDDPDGKQATLTLSLQSRLIPDSSKEGSIADSSTGKWMLDLELPGDRDEEARLRSAAGFPRSVADLGSTQPVSLQWKGVDGKTLYRWLTDTDDGLRFVFRREGQADYVVEDDRSYEPGKDLATRKNVVKDLSSKSQDGIDVLITE